MRLCNFNKNFWLIAPTNSRFLILLPLFYTIIIQILTGFPRSETLREISASELLIRFSEELFDYPFWLQDLSHFPLFFGFSWVWTWYLRRTNRGKNRLFLTIALASGYAILNELTQIYIPQRFPSLGDIVTNLLGVTTAISIHSFVLNRCSLNRKQ
jgi:VanZ family protein